MHRNNRMGDSQSDSDVDDWEDKDDWEIDVANKAKELTKVNCSLIQNNTISISKDLNNKNQINLVDEGAYNNEPVNSLSRRIAKKYKEGDYVYIVEVYDLTPDIKTGDIECCIDAICGDVKLKPVLKWVDDRHALVICDSHHTATKILTQGREVFNLRPFWEASDGSRSLSPNELEPPKPRPKTTTVVAKRILGHHLGRRDLRDKAAEEDLAMRRRQAREQKEASQKANDALWED
uniref:Uncharacterized protein n=1 Tax=Polytomella parva TaxID=51329 RepID=A0A7S0ULK7_9CHLO|mmetsp:Transcript_13908/g.24408  ORF Transcript_13908/g.24408 Transcript_13908/m.24408 type:complete len:235 (+) Transcript_13908:45-749(+)